jgi:hypothetical protein
MELSKLIVAQLVKKYRNFNTIWWLITLFSKALKDEIKLVQMEYTVIWLLSHRYFLNRYGGEDIEHYESITEAERAC